MQGTHFCFFGACPRPVLAQHICSTLCRRATQGNTFRAMDSAGHTFGELPLAYFSTTYLQYLVPQGNAGQYISSSGQCRARILGSRPRAASAQHICSALRSRAMQGSTLREVVSAGHTCFGSCPWPVLAQHICSTLCRRAIQGNTFRSVGNAGHTFGGAAPGLCWHNTLAVFCAAGQHWAIPFEQWAMQDTNLGELSQACFSTTHLQYIVPQSNTGQYLSSSGQCSAHSLGVVPGLF